MNNYFYCYSPKLKAHLLDVGERFICTGLNEKTHSKFWLFVRNDNLDEILTDWHASKPVNA